MRRFAALYRSLDEAAGSAQREAALVAYFREAPAADAAWVAALLGNRRPRRAVAPPQLRQWAAEAAALPLWLVEQSQEVVGDLAEATAHLLEGIAGGRDWPLHRLIEERLLPLAHATGDEKREILQATWRELPRDQHLLWNRLVCGTVRPGVTVGAVARALAAAFGCEAATVAQRLTLPWEPSEEGFRALCTPARGAEEPAASADAAASAGAPVGVGAVGAGRSYPFHLAAPLSGEPRQLGAIAEWLPEWHWRGVRAQLLRQGGAPALWSRGEELVTEAFGEVAAAAEALPRGTVLDGQIVSGDPGRLLAAGLPPPRAARSSGNDAASTAPASFVVCDLLEHGGGDWRARPLVERRETLREVLAAANDPRLLLSPRLEAPSWEALDELRLVARGRGAEGLLLKRLDSPYGAGRDAGTWWKWRAPPHTLEAVLVSAQRGAAERASHYVDYSFALWDEGELVPIAKASGGLPADEEQELDRWVRRSIVERFGPVRQVRPELVFELAFDGVQASSRHKAGLTLRQPRVLRWARERRPEQAASLQALLALLDAGCGDPAR